MKLYVAKSHHNHEGFAIVGIYSNRDVAERACEEDKSSNFNAGDRYSVDEYTLDVKSNE